MQHSPASTRHTRVLEAAVERLCERRAPASSQILRALDGATATVRDVRHYTKRQRTHDPTIKDTHTYYVLAGKTPTLVHNSNWASGRNLNRHFGNHREGNGLLLEGGV